jgi:beta-glucanase (GH16 family)
MKSSLYTFLFIFTYCLVGQSSSTFAQQDTTTSEKSNIDCDYLDFKSQSYTTRGQGTWAFYEGWVSDEEDVFDGNWGTGEPSTPDNHTVYYDICQKHKETGSWNHRFFKRTILKGTPENGLPICDENEYQEIFRDDFNGEVINEDFWDINQDRGGLCNNSEIGVSLPQNVKIVDGILVLEMRKLDVPEIAPCDDVENTNGSFAYSTGTIATGYGQNTGFRFGEFEAKIRVPDDKKKMTGAMWFWGLGPEVDIFEQLQGEKLPYMQSNIHNWLVPPTRAPDLHPNERHPTYSYDFEITSPKQFHVYKFVWTPYYIEMSLDGNVFRKLYRFYQIEEVDNNKKLKITALECSNIPDNEPFETFEHIAWSKNLHYFPMRMIFGTGVKDDSKDDLGSMEIDYVSVRQKTPFKFLPEEDLICLDSSLLSLNTEIPDTRNPNWEVSSNLEVLAFTNKEIQFRLKPILEEEADTGLGWVRMHYETTDATIGNGKPESDLGQTLLKEIEVGRRKIYVKQLKDTPCSIIQKLAVTNSREGEIFDFDIEYFTSENEFVEITDENNYQKIEISVIPPDEGIDVAYQGTITSECGKVQEVSGFIQFENCKNEKEDIGTLNVYPNPTNGETLNVTLDAELLEILKKQTENKSMSQIFQDCRLEINEFVTGKTLLKINEISEEFQLDISQFSSGVYYLHFTRNEEERVVKFIKN